MMVEKDEPDLDLLHPRLTPAVIGQEAAEQRLLSAYFSGKMHHAWILGGMPGIGKATLAYRMAAFVLRHPDPLKFDTRPKNLTLDPDDPVGRQIVSQGHPDLLCVTPAWDPKNKRFKTEIEAVEARQIANFFSRTAGAGGWRVCIIDPAGSINATAANGLLKILEEPPARALFFLVADVPGRLLRTIRSRCLRLDLKPLEDRYVIDILKDLVARSPELDMPEAPSVTMYSRGSPGRALQIIQEGGLKSFGNFLDFAKNLPHLDRKAAMGFAQQLASKSASAEFLAFCDLLLLWLTTHTGSAARGGEEAGSLRPVVKNPAAWAWAYDEISRSLRRVNALNLDKQNAILDILNILSRAAGEPPSGGGGIRAGM